MTLPAFSDVLAARQRLAPVIRRTPLIASDWLSRISGGDARLKLESLQISHSFKARGALNALLVLASKGGRSVVTASAGNHGRAIAWAASRVGLAATVFTPRTAPAAKVEAIRGYGADLRAIAEDYEEAEALALAFSSESGAPFVSPYNHPDVVAGGGTLGLDVVEDWPEVEALLVPVGGGGLVSGVALSLRALRPASRVIGVEAEASAAFNAARVAGGIVHIDVKPTIADGLGGNVEPGTITWPLIRDLVDELVTVSEGDLREAIRGLVREEHLIAEGAGAAGVAAVAAGRADVARRRAAIVVSGANIDADRLGGILGGGGCPN